MDEKPESEYLSFQLATFECEKDWMRNVAAPGSLLAALVSTGSKPFVVIEIASDPRDPGAFAILISLADGDPTEPPAILSCWLALSNRVKWCDAARRRGFPIVEAIISREQPSVRSAQAEGREDTSEKAQAQPPHAPLAETSDRVEQSPLESGVGDASILEFDDSPAEAKSEDVEDLLAAQAASGSPDAKKTSIPSPRLVVEAARYGIAAAADGSAASRGASLAFGKLFLIDFRIDGDDVGDTSESLSPIYRKNLVAPDAANALHSVLLRNDSSQPKRSQVRGTSDVAIESHKAWYPDLVGLLGEKSTSRKAWLGVVVNPLLHQDAAPSSARQSLQAPAGTPVIQPGAQQRWSPVRRRDVFGPPRFAFDNVDIVGFRIDVSEAKDAKQFLQQLIRPLNFHLDDPSALYSNDFMYAVATPVLVIELLRYRKMRLTKDWPPVRTMDYQAQHELLLRVLVGRVDDDTPQARDAAVHVPAIFVDNPWSKALGRDIQGFPKVLANFSAGGKEGLWNPLSMEGRGTGEKADLVSLMQIDCVRLVEKMGEKGDNTDDVIQIEYSNAVDRTDRGFEQVDLAGVAGRLTRNSSPWRQSDFDAVEFRRSFARPVVSRGFHGFRSLQASPVDRVDAADEVIHTWVNGTIRTKNLRYRFPTGMATIRLPRCLKAPREWQMLGELLGNAPTSFSTGRWYRAQCSMTLTIEDGLRW